MKPRDVSAVVCTKNSISGIERCLTSLRVAGVDQIIVVDAHSTDGTREVANSAADIVLEDPGMGLGNARNIGIARTTQPLILNMGSDNVMPPRAAAGHDRLAGEQRIPGSQRSDPDRRQ